MTYPLPDGSTNRGHLTPNKAAAEIRHKIIRKMDSLEFAKNDDDYIVRWIKLRRFINGMAKRGSAKKGGLGRK